MNFAVQTALLIALLIVCCFAPGFFFVRRLRLSPLEKIGASIGLSLIVIYLDTLIVYVVSGGPGGTRLSAAPFVLSSITFVVLGVAAGKDLIRLVCSFRAKQALLGFGFLFLWTLLILSTIRVYSGAQWSGDWVEHFQRTLFFLQRLPANTVFGEVYTVPARPPFMNVVAGFFLAQTQDRFEFFQIIFSFLNLLVFLPACLILPAIAAARQTRILPLVVLFALNPVVMQNATYPWTKSLTAFFIILGLAFYLSARRKRDSPRMVAAFVSLAAGILVHYSAGAYVVVITFHYLFWLFWKRPQKWKELAAIGITCTVLLTSYFAWAMTVYGVGAFRSISSISPNQENQGNHVARITANLFDSIVPSLIRDPSLMRQSIVQPNSLGWIRDVAFLFYQPNVVFAMGLIGGPAILWLLFRRLRHRSRKHSHDRALWFGFVSCFLLLGVAVIGGREPLGLAHGVLLSVEVLGLTLLASAIGRRRTLTVLVLAGSLVDFSLGVFLHAHVQSLENDAEKIFFSDLVYTNGIVRHADPGPDNLSETAWQNWFVKHQRALCDRWLKDLPERYSKETTFQTVWPAYHAQISKLMKEDELQWGGWYSRHDGEMRHLGDHVAGPFGERLPLSILLLLLAGLIALYLKNTPAMVLASPKPKPRGRAKSRSR